MVTVSPFKHGNDSELQLVHACRDQTCTCTAGMLLRSVQAPHCHGNAVPETDAFT